MRDDPAAPGSPLDAALFDPESGLLPAIVQSAADGEVLMLGWMDREALAATLGGRVTFFSRSRRRRWTKGETSGHWLETVEVRLDCDGDALLVRALPHGPTCHTGALSCFHSGREAPETPGLGAVLAELWSLIQRRDRDRPPGSYTTGLLAGGATAAARKVAEEGVEVALAALAEPERVAEESADLLYHLLVLWRATGAAPGATAAVLAARRRGGARPEPGGEG